MKTFFVENAMGGLCLVLYTSLASCHHKAEVRNGNESVHFISGQEWIAMKQVQIKEMNTGR